MNLTYLCSGDIKVFFSIEVIQLIRLTTILKDNVFGGKK